MKRLLPVALLGLLLAIAVGCGSTPTEPDDPIADPPGPMTAADLQFCRDETNRYRARDGRSAVALSESLSDRSRQAAESDHASGIPHGYFQTHPVAAENEVLRWSGTNVRQTITSALAAFYGEGVSGGHYQNLMGPYAEVGCGVATSSNAITFVQNLR